VRLTVYFSWVRGVATGWSGVDMSIPLLSEVVPEIDANMVSFYGRRGKKGCLSGPRSA